MNTFNFSLPASSSNKESNMQPHAKKADKATPEKEEKVYTVVMPVANIGSVTIEFPDQLPPVVVDGRLIPWGMVEECFTFGLKTKLHNARKPSMTDEEKRTAMIAQLDAFEAGYPTISDHKRALNPSKGSSSKGKALSMQKRVELTMIKLLANKQESEEASKKILALPSEVLLPAVKAKDEEAFNALVLEAQAHIEAEEEAKREALKAEIEKNAGLLDALNL